MRDFLKIAIGVQKNENFFSEGHFGESNKFLIYNYSISRQKMELSNIFNNTSAEEKSHGDPVKAKGVASIIGDVDIIFAHALGENIIRMKKKYLILISRSLNIHEALNQLPNKIDKILEEMEKSFEDRKIIHI
ncbi:MAG: NifB/NifX family molybdenum-iron cluster-binding protein [Promethearchaeota archaeon]